MIFAAVEVIPLIITWKRLLEDVAAAELMIVLEASTPFTVEVSALPIEERMLVVVGRRPRMEVVEITPFTLVVRVPAA